VQIFCSCRSALRCLVQAFQLHIVGVAMASATFARYGAPQQAMRASQNMRPKWGRLFSSSSSSSKSHFQHPRARLIETARAHRLSLYCKTSRNPLQGFLTAAAAPGVESAALSSEMVSLPYRCFHQIHAKISRMISIAHQIWPALSERSPRSASCSSSGRAE